MSTLIVLAHPALHRSLINSHLLNVVESLKEIDVLNLYETYPDFDIDVKQEQNRLRNYENIILQHPLYWYSTPSLLKEWVDLVFEHGFAYGQGTYELAGKILTQAISAGGDLESYQSEGFNRFRMEELTRPMEATAHFCAMIWKPAFITYGGHTICSEKISNAGEAYRKWLLQFLNNK